VAQNIDGGKMHVENLRVNFDELHYRQCPLWLVARVEILMGKILTISENLSN